MEAVAAFLPPGDLVMQKFVGSLESSLLPSTPQVLHSVINSSNVMLTLFIWLPTPGDGFTYVLNVFQQYLEQYFILMPPGTWSQLSH